MSALVYSPHFVLIDLQLEANLDRDVAPAAIEFVLRNLIPKKPQENGVSPSICLFNIDRPLRQFEQIIKRGTIGRGNVVDCYTNWYSEWIPLARSASVSNVPVEWHIASATTPENKMKSFLHAIGDAFPNASKHHSKGRVIVIDSLSSILSLSPDLVTVLQLLDSLRTHSAEQGNGIDAVIMLVATFRSFQMEKPLVNGLQKLADIYIAVHQFSYKPNQASSSNLGEDRNHVRINVRKRRTSGRAQFDEYIARMDWDNIELREIRNGLDMSDARRDQDKQSNGKETETLELAQHGLSFRVTLSSKEREVRAAAGLPYLHRDEDLANSALEIHPENLRVGKSIADDIEMESSDASSDGSDGEDMFSEDV